MYCTIDDMKAVYHAKQLSQLTGDAAGIIIDHDRLNRAIGDFGSYMKSYVDKLYPGIVFNFDNHVLNPINVEGAFLYLKRNSPGGLSDADMDGLGRLDKILERIATGGQVLAPPGGTDPGPNLDIASLFSSNKRLFGRGV